MDNFPSNTDISVKIWKTNILNERLKEVKMTVEELIKMLKKYPKDMEVIHTRCSDYNIIEEDEWSIVEAVPNT